MSIAYLLKYLTSGKINDRFSGEDKVNDTGVNNSSFRNCSYYPKASALGFIASF